MKATSILAGTLYTLDLPEGILKVVVNLAEGQHCVLLLRREGTLLRCRTR